MKPFRRSALSLLPLAAVAWLATPALASPLDDACAGDAAGNQPPSMADETVGTLPSFWQDDDWFWQVAAMDASLLPELGMLSYEVWIPAVVPVEDVVVKATGKGFVLMSVLGQGATAQRRLRFFGDLRVVLDERDFLSVGGALRVSVGGSFAGVTADVLWQGSPVSTVSLGSIGSSFEVQVSGGETGAMLHQSPLVLVGDSPKGYGSVSTLAGDGTHLRLTQFSKAKP